MKVERTSEPGDRTDDPVRMYLREMGSVELLSREGEIAIAKRIEAGREAMIQGLCESPLTFQAIIIWRDELNEGKILLRDIIDLEATYAGPDAKAAPVQPLPQAAPADHGKVVKLEPRRPESPRERRQAIQERARRRDDEYGDVLAPEDFDTPTVAEEPDEEDEENNVSLAAMEAELKPKVLETFDRIAKTYKSLRKLQDQEVAEKTALSQSQERRYKKLREEIISDVKSLSLNAARIEALVDQLYGINKQLISLEGRLMRLAETYRIPREVFLQEYQGEELDTNWMRRVARLAKFGWKRFLSRGARHGQGACARRSIRSPPTRGCKSRSSGASCTWCRRASARRGRRRRKWSRRICDSSSPSPRNTRTGAFNFSTSSRKATSA